MPNINSIITRDDVNVGDRDAIFEVIRDAIVGPFLDACPAGVTAEVVEFHGGWEVKANVSKAIARTVRRHEALNAIGAGVYANPDYGVRREVTRGFGSDIQLAVVRLIQDHHRVGSQFYDVTVTVASLAVGSDDRSQHVSTTTLDGSYKPRNIRVANIKAAAKKQGTAIYDSLLDADEHVKRFEDLATETIARRTANATTAAAVTEAKATINVEWTVRHDAATGTLSFQYLPAADALRILEAVKALPIPAPAR